MQAVPLLWLPGQDASAMDTQLAHSDIEPPSVVPEPAYPAADNVPEVAELDGLREEGASVLGCEQGKVAEVPANGAIGVAVGEKRSRSVRGPSSEGDRPGSSAREAMGREGMVRRIVPAAATERRGTNAQEGMVQAVSSVAAPGEDTRKESPCMPVGTCTPDVKEVSARDSTGVEQNGGNGPNSGTSVFAAAVAAAGEGRDAVSSSSSSLPEIDSGPDSEEGDDV
jgi:hypothetical protein